MASQREGRITVLMSYCRLKTFFKNEIKDWSCDRKLATIYFYSEIYMTHLYKIENTKGVGTDSVNTLDLRVPHDKIC